MLELLNDWACGDKSIFGCIFSFLFLPKKSQLLLFITYYFPITCFLITHHRAKDHNFAMQYQLNVLEVGGRFDSCLHTAKLLALLFFAMTFAPGLPLLMPLCFLSFVLMFRVDKLLLLRYFRRPSFSDNKIMVFVLHLLPFAAVLRLAMGVWMFSSNGVMASSIGKISLGLAEVNSEDYHSFLAGIKNDGVNHFINDRVATPYGFPLFVLLVIVVGVLVMQNIYKYTPMYWTYIMLRLLLKKWGERSEKKKKEKAIAAEAAAEKAEKDKNVKIKSNTAGKTDDTKDVKKEEVRNLTMPLTLNLTLTLTLILTLTLNTKH